MNRYIAPPDRPQSELAIRDGTDELAEAFWDEYRRAGGNPHHSLDSSALKIALGHIFWIGKED